MYFYCYSSLKCDHERIFSGDFEEEKKQKCFSVGWKARDGGGVQIYARSGFVESFTGKPEQNADGSKQILRVG